MKKLIVLPIVIFLLCGCSKHNNLTPILNNISFIAHIEHNEDLYVADVTVVDGALNLVLSKPDVLKGLILNMDKNTLMAEFEGVKYTHSADSIQQVATMGLFNNILQDVQGRELILNNDNCETSGKVDGYKYKFTFSPSGLPLAVEIDELNFKIKFNNVVLK